MYQLNTTGLLNRTPVAEVATGSLCYFNWGGRAALGICASSIGNGYRAVLRFRLDDASEHAANETHLSSVSDVVYLVKNYEIRADPTSLTFDNRQDAVEGTLILSD